MQIGKKGWNNRIFILLIFFVSLSILLFAVGGGVTGAVTGVELAEVEEGIVKEFEKGNEEVPIIVMLEEEALAPLVLEEKKKVIKKDQEKVLQDLHLEDKERIFGLVKEKKEFTLNHQYASVNAFSGTTTREGLEKLQANPKVKNIVANKVRRIFLDDSVPLIQADKTWNITLSGFPIDGSGETVCIIDTGVNYNLEALGGGYGNKVISGYDFVNDDNDPMDDHGHGTHIAGIIASTDNQYKGVAPGAKLVAIKVCSPDGYCADDDVVAGLDWCITNASLYNISVISISLGGEQTDTYCDQDLGSVYAPSINQAVTRNISVVVATGNTNPTNYPNATAGVAVPACVMNSTRVTATTKSDDLAGYAFRHPFFDSILAAPGSSIKSFNKAGGISTMSGTSMSTPHVSGAIALLHQFTRLQGKSPLTSQEVKEVLLLNGKPLFDTETGVNFSRIDLYSTISSLDNVSPVLTFVPPTPDDNSLQNGSSTTISLISSETLQEVLLEWNGENETMDGSNTYFSLTKSNLTGLAYSFRVHGRDLFNNYAVSETRTFLFAASPDLTFNIDSTYSSPFFLNISIADTYTLSTASYQIINSSEGIVQENFTASINDTNFVWKDFVNVSAVLFSDGYYTITAFANNSLSLVEEDSFAFIVDKSPPSVYLGTPLNSTTLFTSSANFTFNYSDFSSSSSIIAFCQLFIDNLMIANGTFNLTGVLSTSSLEEGAHQWWITCTDAAGNEGISAKYNLTIETADLRVILLTPTEGLDFNTGTLLLNASILSNLPVDKVYFNLTQGEISFIQNASFDGNDLWSAAFNLSILDESTFSVRVFANDSQGNYNLSEFVNVNIDRTFPEISDVSADVTETSAEIIWSTDELADSNVYFTNPNGLEEEEISPAMTISHKITLLDLSASTIYSYDISSCDYLGNCNIKSSTFTTDSPPADDSNSGNSGGSGSGSGGSGGGGESSGVAVPSSLSLTDNEVEEVSVEEEMVFPNIPEKKEKSQQVRFLRVVSISKNEPLVLSIDKPEIVIEQLTIKARVDKDINILVKPFTEVPSKVDLFPNVYQYLEITTGLAAEQLESALFVFSVPRSWVEEKGKKVNLYVYEKESWNKLKTSLVEEKKDSFTYKSETDHLSYFAVAANGRNNNLVGAVITNFFRSDVLSTVGVVLLFFIIMAIAFFIFWKISRKDKVSEAVLDPGVVGNESVSGVLAKTVVGRRLIKSKGKIELDGKSRRSMDIVRKKSLKRAAKKRKASKSKKKVSKKSSSKIRSSVGKKTTAKRKIVKKKIVKKKVSKKSGKKKSK